MRVYYKIDRDKQYGTGERAGGKDWSWVGSHGAISYAWAGDQVVAAVSGGQVRLPLSVYSCTWRGLQGIDVIRALHVHHGGSGEKLIGMRDFAQSIYCEERETMSPVISKV